MTMLDRSVTHAKKRRCDNCGKSGAIEKRITRVYGRGSNALIIENVPVIVCPYCDASYLEVKTLHEIERIKLHRKSFAKQKPLDVATFALQKAAA
jgi:YgiT-type zinc finger domain-containing protein